MIALLKLKKKVRHHACIYILLKEEDGMNERTSPSMDQALFDHHLYDSILSHTYHLE